MKLVDEIIELLIAKDGSLADAMLKTKVLLHGMGQFDLEAWVNSELNGYNDDEKIPEYRKINSQVLANMTSITFQAKAHPIPLGHLTKKELEILETAEMRESLSVLEKFANQNGSLQRSIPLEANFRLGKTLAPGVHIQSAWCEIQTSSIVQILTEIRTRFLDFILRLKDQLPEEATQEEQKAVDATSIFNNSVLGDNAVIIIGNKNKTNMINQHLLGNKNALIHELKKYDVADEDISQLFSAIEFDEKNCTEQDTKKFGDRVKTWVQKMLHKAVETSWNIEVGIASSILNDALKSYYG